ncbi:MAG: hypothetical protein AUJ92_17695 [Armatimonadetes bacterium CG2_30_59_28]|nr:MAG: hypothetical protein AUJ92_17695 [Armatimonadetes bacterium CG2_30_59_28]
MSDTSLQNKRIALGISGGIAAYRAAELASTLVQGGAQVRVVMTANATKFIQPVTFAALTGNRVGVGMFDESAVASFEHLTLTEESDLLVIAPATANVMAKLAGGIADDLLTATALAARCPILVAPAMNTNMWLHPATRANLRTLENRGVSTVGPAEGRLACGVSGPGRLASIDEIVAAVREIFDRKSDLKGLRLLITAGATREPLDPVRFISNYSSGRMGVALAEAARDRGGAVTLLCGATSVEAPNGVEIVPTPTAQDMCDEAVHRFPDVDIVVSAAAIADFRPRTFSQRKIKKEGPSASPIELENAPDLLRTLGGMKDKQILVGFAAETNDLIANAKEKLTSKNLDIVVANDITREGAGFDTETNVVTLITRDGGPVDFPKMAKRAVADGVIDEIVRMLDRDAGCVTASPASDAA